MRQSRRSPITKSVSLNKLNCQSRANLLARIKQTLARRFDANPYALRMFRSKDTLCLCLLFLCHFPAAAQKKNAKINTKTGRNTRKNPLLLLNNRALVDGILGRQEEQENLSDEQLQDQTAEIKTLLDDLHAADLADLLEALPNDERLALWRLVKMRSAAKHWLKSLRPCGIP